MITGMINEALEPLLDDVFIEGKKGPIALRTILDTGFNGAFCLPRKYADDAKIEFLSEVEAEFGDGNVVIEEVYLGSLLVNKKPIVVEITLTDSETALMGMKMIIEKVAVFNLKTMDIKVY